MIETLEIFDFRKKTQKLIEAVEKSVIKIT